MYLSVSGEGPETAFYDEANKTFGSTKCGKKKRKNF